MSIVTRASLEQHFWKENHPQFAKLRLKPLHLFPPHTILTPTTVPITTCFSCPLSVTLLGHFLKGRGSVSLAMELLHLASLQCVPSVVTCMIEMQLRDHITKIKRYFWNTPIQIALVSNRKVQEFEMEWRAGLPPSSPWRWIDGFEQLQTDHPTFPFF